MIHVRSALATDIAVLAQMQIEMATETEAFRLNLATVMQGVEAVFKDPRKGNYWVAVNSEDKILGMLLTIPEWSDWRNGSVLWIHSVYTLPEARGKGVFKTLYAHLKREVQQNPGLRGLRLYVEKNNLKAQSVYQNLGMSSDHYHLFEWMKEF